jgi:putative SbcD/Mre11-related phosphoesterase
MRVLDDWLLLPQRFAVHEPSATAVLADLHLGYCAARQRQGDAVPARSVRDDLRPLIDAARPHDLRNVIVAGDLFERGYDADIASQFVRVLEENRIRLIGLVPGNHDRVGAANEVIPILGDSFELEGWQIVHGDRPCNGERAVMGHWHPALRWRRRKTPCFMVHEWQLILPAFSSDAAGSDVDADERWRAWRRYPIHNMRVIRASKLTFQVK